MIKNLFALVFTVIMETNVWGTYVLPVDREDGPEWREKWNSGEFSIGATYGLVNGKPRLVFWSYLS